MLRFAAYLFVWIVDLFILSTSLVWRRWCTKATTYEKGHEKADVCILLRMWLKRIVARTFDLIGTGLDDRGIWSQPAQRPMATKGQRLLTPSSAKLSAETRLGPDSFRSNVLHGPYGPRIGPAQLVTAQKGEWQWYVTDPSISELVSCPGG